MTDEPPPVALRKEVQKSQSPRKVRPKSIKKNVQRTDMNLKPNMNKIESTMQPLKPYIDNNMPEPIEEEDKKEEITQVTQTDEHLPTEEVKEFEDILLVNDEDLVNVEAKLEEQNLHKESCVTEEMSEEYQVRDKDAKLLKDNDAMDKYIKNLYNKFF